MGQTLFPHWRIVGVCNFCLLADGKNQAFPCLDRFLYFPSDCGPGLDCYPYLNKKREIVNTLIKGHFYQFFIGATKNRPFIFVDIMWAIILISEKFGRKVKGDGKR